MGPPQCPRTLLYELVRDLLWRSRVKWDMPLVGSAYTPHVGYRAWQGNNAKVVNLPKPML